MKVWLSCFLVLFAMVELFQWLKQFSLPLPIQILGGAFLAIASNYDKFVTESFQKPDSEPSSMVNSVKRASSDTFGTQAIPTPEPPQSISFTINSEVKQHHPSEIDLN